MLCQAPFFLHLIHAPFLFFFFLSFLKHHLLDHFPTSEYSFSPLSLSIPTHYATLPALTHDTIRLHLHYIYLTEPFRALGYIVYGI